MVCGRSQKTVDGSPSDPRGRRQGTRSGAGRRCCRSSSGRGAFPAGPGVLLRSARRPLPRGRDQRPTVRRRRAARVHASRAGTPFSTPTPRSLFLTNRAAVRQMLAQPLDEHGLRGTVLNMGSVLGWSPAPDFFGTIAYAASKGAIRAMTLNAAARYARDRIRFNLIAPGSDRDADGRPRRRRPGDPCLPRDQAADGRRARARPRTAPRRPFTSASRPRGSSPASVLNVDGGWCVSEGQLPARAASSHSSSTDSP